MNFPAIELAIIGIIVIVIGIIFTIYRTRKKPKKDFITSTTFLVMGVIWVIVGLIYSVVRETDIFEIGLFNLGLIFALAGLIGLIIEKYTNE